MQNHQKPQRGWNWGLILLIIIVAGMWLGAYSGWKA